MQTYNIIKPWHRINLVRATWQRSTALWPCHGRATVLPKVWWPIVGQWVPYNMPYLLTHAPSGLSAPRTLRLAVRLARAFGRNPRNLLLALYRVPHWVPYPVHQWYTYALPYRLYPAGYMYL